MKFLGKLFNWIVLPGVFALAIATGDQRFAQAGSALLWAVGLIIGPLAFVMLIGCMAMKPEHPKWEENKRRILGKRSWLVTKVIGWTALFATVALSAFTGFIVTAIFYLIAILWARLAWALVEAHFKEGEA